jgi:hypothetical protein
MRKPIKSNFTCTEIRGKGKDKVIPVFLTEHYVMKAYWGNGSIVPLIL